MAMKRINSLIKIVLLNSAIVTVISLGICILFLGDNFNAPRTRWENNGSDFYKYITLRSITIAPAFALTFLINVYYLRKRQYLYKAWFLILLYFDVILIASVYYLCIFSLFKQYYLYT